MRAITGLATLGCAFAAGCGPMNKPMVDRLDEETQKNVDDAWSNMFTPPERLDRTLLLDVILTAQLYQAGIERLHMTSEKRVNEGVVVMEIHFEKDHPEFDVFSVTFLDRTGREVRRERYTRADVEGRFRFFSDPRVPGCEDTENQTPEARQACVEAMQALQAEREARYDAIRAATQPTERQR